MVIQQIDNNFSISNNLDHLYQKIIKLSDEFFCTLISPEEFYSLIENKPLGSGKYTHMKNPPTQSDWRALRDSCKEDTDEYVDPVFELGINQ